MRVLPLCVLPYCTAQVSACALELYNEDLKDLAVSGGRDGEAAAR